MAASPPAVYSAFIDPQALMKWLPPDGMDGRVDAFEPRVGGRVEITLTYVEPDPAARGKATERTDVTRGRFLELTPGRIVVMEIGFVSTEPELAGVMLMRWELRPVARGTEVTIVCENVPAAISAEDHAAGLASSLDNLATLVESGSQAALEPESLSRIR